MPEDVKAHRLFDLPDIVYPADTRMEHVRLFLTFVVDARGRVKCVIGDGRFFAPDVNEQRRLFLNSEPLDTHELAPARQSVSGCPAFAGAGVS
jgi:hypothetical protein